MKGRGTVNSQQTMSRQKSSDSFRSADPRPSGSRGPRSESTRAHEDGFTTTALRTRRVAMNRSGRGCRCVVVVQNGVACGPTLAVRPSGGEVWPIHNAAQRAKAAADVARTPGRSRAGRRSCSQLPSDCLIRSPLLRFSAAVPHPNRSEPRDLVSDEGGNPVLVGRRMPRL